MRVSSWLASCVADDLLVRGIEIERAADADGDVRQVDQADRAMAFFDVGVGSAAVADGGGEIVEVAPAELIVGLLAADRLVVAIDDEQLAALAEHHPALGAEELDAGVAVVRIVLRPEPHLER